MNTYVYIEKLAHDFGMHDLPKEEREPIISELNRLFEDQLMIKIQQELGKDKTVELAKILESSDETEVFNYISENVDNMMDLMDQTYLDIRKELLTD